MKEFELKEYHYDLIEEVMEEFDFEKMFNVMNYLNWEWATCVENGPSVPTIKEIRKLARSLMKDCIKKAQANEHKLMTISTAGFEVYYNETDRFLSLKFIVEGWDAYKD